MKYHKKVMRLTELIKTDDPDPEKNYGYDKEYLMSIYRSRGQKVAWKGNYKNSPIYFDTEELEKYRRAECTGI